MKKFYAIACSCIAAGLILMGVGSVVCIFEFNSFTYMGDKYADSDKTNIKQLEVTLPENQAKIYYTDGYINVVKDGSLNGNNAVLEAEFYGKYEGDPYIEFYDNTYLYNEYTEEYSKYTVYRMDMSYHFDYENNSGFREFQSILSDIKNREIYNYGYDRGVKNITLRVSEEAYGRFAKVPDGYSLESYGDYMEHMSEKADEADYYTEHVDDYEGDHEYYDD